MSGIKSPTVILAPLLLVLLLLVGGCAGGKSAPEAAPAEPEVEPIVTTGQPAETPLEPETAPAEPKAVAAQPNAEDKTEAAINLCAKITGFTEKQACTSKVAKALAGKDAARAESICTASEDKDTCYQMIAPVIALADEAKAIGLCTEITAYYQDECYKGVGIAAKDAGVCEKASSKDGCYGSVGPVLGKEKGMETCAKVGSFAAEECYGRLAAEVAKADIDAGLTICDATTTDVCYPLVVPIVAKTAGAKAKELCTKVSAQLQDNCYIEVLKVTKEESICDLVQSKDKCYSVVAPLLTKDSGLAYCAKISYFADRENCVEGVAEAIAKSSPADAIAVCDSKSEDKDTCYQVIAPIISAKEPVLGAGLCKKIIADYQDVCYGRAAEASGNVAVCDGAASKDMCYSMVAPKLV